MTSTTFNEEVAYTSGYYDPMLVGLGYALLLLPLVLVGLFLWRRRGARDARDALGGARDVPAGLLRRLLEATRHWALTGLVLLPVAWVTVMALAFLFGVPCSSGPCLPNELPDSLWRQSAAAMGLCVGGLLCWLRASHPERDVLGLTARG